MRRIDIVAYPGFQLVGLGITAVFEIANSTQSAPFYDIRVVSEHGGFVRSSIGVSVETEPLGDTLDTLLIVGGASHFEPSATFLDRIQIAAKASRRVASTCTGAFLLARTGLLDRRRATTHWFYAPRFQEQYPHVLLEEDRIFICDDGVWTSAGMTAMFDLTLALVEDDLGREVSRKVARQLVLYHRRGGGQSQYSILLELDPRTDRVRRVLAFARENLRGDLSVERLSEVAGLSSRQFSRILRAELQNSPARVVEKLRVEAAQALIEDGDYTVEEIVRETGFANREQLRRAFARVVGRSPQAFREVARKARRR